MTTETPTKNIPEKYKRLTKTTAFTLVDVPKTSFYRDWVNTGKISVSKDDKGKDYISIDELIRVFGLESVMSGIRKLEKTEPEPETNQNEEHGTIETDQSTEIKTQTQTRTNQKTLEISVPFEEFMNLKVNLAKAETELEQVKERLSKESQRAEKFQTQYFQEVELSRRLLEDKSKKNDPLPKRSFFDWLLGRSNPNEKQKSNPTGRL